MAGIGAQSGRLSGLLRSVMVVVFVVSAVTFPVPKVAAFGPAFTNAPRCDSDGDSTDDGILIKGRCISQDSFARRPGSRGANGSSLEIRYTYPCSGNSPEGPNRTCLAAQNCPEWPREWGYWRWQREVTYVDGRRTNVGPWVQTGSVCRPDNPTRTVTADEVREVVRVLLPAARPHILPPGGRTLVNLDTIFYTDPDRFVADVQVVGQDVRVRAFAEEYIWHFGDGHSLRTDRKGRPYPHKDNVHRYTTKGSYPVDVDVRFRAEFRVRNSGRWQPIPGLITIDDGPVVQLAVLESWPALSTGR